jgi:uncharacterized ferredoxin-like protein
LAIRVIINTGGIVHVYQFKICGRIGDSEPRVQRVRGFENCAACQKAGAACVFTAMDLGIALGSAVALAADNRVDNRLMFTIGQAAASLGLLGEYKMLIGIPLSVQGKSVFYDRANP